MKTPSLSRRGKILYLLCLSTVTVCIISLAIARFRNTADEVYHDHSEMTVPDVCTVSAEFLIHNIDAAFSCWKGCPWSSHVSKEDFLEWMLPYKMAELQQTDSWRDTLQALSWGYLSSVTHDDVEYGTAMKTAEVIRSGLAAGITRYGLYERSGLPLLSAGLLAGQTFGDIPDYALTGALTLRASGLPVVLDETPVGARHEAAARWFVLLGDKCSEEPSEWDIATAIGWGFFPYERGPKVWRRTYAVNPQRLEYRRKARFVYPFDLTVKDVTDRYFLTSDISIPVGRKVLKELEDNYVYIASGVRDTSSAQQSRSFTGEFSKSLPEAVRRIGNGWRIVDFGRIRRGSAMFRNMGREVLYATFGWDGDKLIPISPPFILNKDGSIRYVSNDSISSPEYDRWRNNPLL